MGPMNRFLWALAPVGAALLLAPNVPGCAGNSSGCNDGQLARDPAFVIPFEDRVDEVGCTLSAFLYDEAGTRTRMQCAAYLEDCLCQGGGLPGIYELVVYDRESSAEIDDAEVTISSAAAPECRSVEVTRPFDGAFRHSFYGAGGAGGAGGAAADEP